MKRLLVITAAIEAGTGVGLLAAPALLAQLLLGGTLDTPAAVMLGRVTGSALLALGIACWLARHDSQSRAARGLVSAMLLYNLATIAVLTFADIGFGLHGVGLWPAVVVHAVMTIWCVVGLQHGPPNVPINSYLQK